MCDESFIIVHILSGCIHKTNVNQSSTVTKIKIKIKYAL